MGAIGHEIAPRVTDATAPRIGSGTAPEPRGRREFAFRVAMALAIAALAVACWQLLDLLLIAYAAALFAILLHSLSDRLTAATSLHPNWSLAVVVVAALLLLGGVITLFGVQLAHELRAIGTGLPAAWHALQLRLAPIGIAPENLEAIRVRLSDGTGLAAIGDIATRSLNALGGLLLALAGGIYLAADPRTYRRGLLLLVPRPLIRPVAGTVDDVVRALKRWLVGQIVIMAAVGVMTGLGAWAIGLPGALALGVIAALLEFVPYIGPIATAVPAVLLGAAVSTEMAIAALVLLFAVQQLEGYVLTPLIQHQAVSLPPALTLFSIFAMGILFGVPGILLAAPLTVTIYVTVRRLVGRRPAPDIR